MNREVVEDRVAKVVQGQRNDRDQTEQRHEGDPQGAEVVDLPEESNAGSREHRNDRQDAEPHIDKVRPHGHGLHVVAGLELVRSSTRMVLLRIRW